MSKNVKAVVVNLAGPGHLSKSVPYKKPVEDMLSWTAKEVERAIARFPSIDRIVLRNPLGQYRASRHLPAFHYVSLLQHVWLRDFIGWYQSLGYSVDLYGNTLGYTCLGNMELGQDIHIPAEDDSLAITAGEKIVAVMKMSGADRMWFDAPGWANSLNVADHICSVLTMNGVEYGFENVPKPAQSEEASSIAYQQSVAFTSLVGNMPRGVDDDAQARPDDDERDRPTPEDVFDRLNLSRRAGIISPEQEAWVWINNKNWEGEIYLADVGMPIMVPSQMI